MGCSRCAGSGDRGHLGDRPRSRDGVGSARGGGDEDRPGAIRGNAGVDVEVGLLDLSSLESVRRFTAEFLATHDRLDVLVNNAGTMTGRRMETPDGLEWTFGVNHVGPFLLTALLTNRLVSGAPSRVIGVSSEVHRSARRGLDFTDLQMTRGWSARKAYAASKLATGLMTVELDRRLAGRGVSPFWRGDAGPWTRQATVGGAGRPDHDAHGALGS